ncbi:MAG: molybdopterin molybdotransferase MoeA [Pseudomonadota bacterium]|nr:molybdopterin molybdotransferase MoeA [Pseudomonadota bacterium]
MKKKKIKLTLVKDAKYKMKQSIKLSKKTEHIKIEKSEGRILSKNIIANFNIPEEDNSAVDGYAINLKNNERLFSIIGESKPGKPFKKRLKKNEAIKIFTGSNILKENKVNTVVMLEDCKILKDSIEIINSFTKGQNIRKKGEDVKKNTIVFREGRKIRPVDLAQLLSLGIKKIDVYKKIKVGIFSTGSEINKNSKRKKNYIFDANKLTLISMFKKIGCDAFDLGLVKDDFYETKKKILESYSKFDLLVSTGGISSSDTDMVGKILSNFGKIKFWKLAIKPGRPFAFGEIKKTPFIGLPGNPVAAIVTFLMLVVDYVKILSGDRNYKVKKDLINANFSMKKKLGRREWIRGWVTEKNSKKYLEKFDITGSGIISSITQSDGIIDIDENVEYIRKGEKLNFIRYEDILK